MSVKRCLGSKHFSMYCTTNHQEVCQNGVSIRWSRSKTLSSYKKFTTDTTYKILLLLALFQVLFQAFLVTQYGATLWADDWLPNAMVLEKASINQYLLIFSQIAVFYSLLLTLLFIKPKYMLLWCFTKDLLVLSMSVHCPQLKPPV